MSFFFALVLTASLLVENAANIFISKYAYVFHPETNKPFCLSIENDRIM